METILYTLVHISKSCHSHTGYPSHTSVFFFFFLHFICDDEIVGEVGKSVSGETILDSQITEPLWGERRKPAGFRVEFPERRVRVAESVLSSEWEFYKAC